MIISTNKFNLKKEIQNTNKKIYQPNNQISCILAPSWGENMIIEKYGYEIIQKLIEKNIKVYFRPHPRSVQLNFKIIKRILNKFNNNNNFVYNPKISSIKDMYYSNFMISDWSGAAIEYSIVFKKPILFIDTLPKIKNHEYLKINIEPLEKKLRNKIGKIIYPNSIDDIYNYILDVIYLNKNNKFDYEAVYKAYYYNCHNATEICANELSKLYLKQ